MVVVCGVVVVVDVASGVVVVNRRVVDKCAPAGLWLVVF